MLLIIFVGWIPFPHIRGDMEWQWCSKFLQAPRKIVGSALNWHQAGLTHPVDLSLCLKSLPKRKTEKDSWKPYLDLLQRVFLPVVHFANEKTEAQEREELTADQG